MTGRPPDDTETQPDEADTEIQPDQADTETQPDQAAVTPGHQSAATSSAQAVAPGDPAAPADQATPSGSMAETGDDPDGRRPSPGPSPTSRARRVAAAGVEARRPSPRPRPAAGTGPSSGTGEPAAPTATAPTATAPPATAPPASASTGESPTAVEPPVAGPVEPGAPRPARQAPLWLAVLLAVLVLAGVAAVVVAATRPSSSGSVGERDRALAAAKSEVPLILSYDYAHFDADVAKAKAQLTGRAVTDYTTAMTQTIKPAAIKVKAVVQAQTDGAGVESVAPDGRQVTVVVFGEQKVTNTSLSAPRTDLFRVRATLDLVGGQWLVSKFDQI
jgi:Mce-associated membrane protein